MDKQLNAHFDFNIKLYWIDRKQTRKFIAIMSAIVYSYTHFSYLLLFGQTYMLIVPIVVNRIRCVQLSFYLDMLDTRLGYVNMEMNSLVTSDVNEAFSKLCFDKLVRLKEMFSVLFQTSVLLNDCFSWSIAAITTEIFLELTINSYLLYISMVTKGLSATGLTIYCLGMAPTIFAFLLSCWSADRCTDKVKILHSLGGTFNKTINILVLRIC